VNIAATKPNTKARTPKKPSNKTSKLRFIYEPALPKSVTILRIPNSPYRPDMEAATTIATPAAVGKLVLLIAFA
jgi:hypothetical protein